jgi:hypothetical protein
MTFDKMPQNIINNYPHKNSHKMLMKNFLKTAYMRAPVNQRAAQMLAFQFRYFTADNNNKNANKGGA